MKNRCDECEHWVPVPDPARDGVGECRIGPPEIDYHETIASASRYRGRWPLTLASEGCSHGFQPITPGGDPVSQPGG